ncbi:uncharacterized protein LOC122849423 [Aphidius gifuensis]|uniref:uncharacterized protein LOC122849423 n=1 Tax=Aphidius gifuensis TaxID=684658 RepID=UPI001CDD5CBE|nr:uncharacterized protein LOC122849423 [Aphidius gifuensis]
MSVILRNTLRFVGTAKYATNSTKYVRSIFSQRKILDDFKEKELKLSDPNNYFIIKNNNEPTSFYQKLWSAFSGKVYVDENTLYITKIDYFVASVSCVEASFETPIKKKKFYLSPALSIKANEKSIEPVITEIVDEKPFSSHNDTIRVSRKDGKFTLQKLDSGETVTLNHTIYLEAHTKERQTEEGGKGNIPSILIADIVYDDTKITSKVGKEEPKTFTHTPKLQPLNSKKKYKDERILEYDDDDEDKTIKIDLQFPMTMSLEVTPRTIHVKELGDTFSIYYKVDIQTSIKSTENLENKIPATKEGEKSKIGKIEILLNSGDLVLRTPGYFNDIVKTNYKVWITVDFDGPAPSIKFNIGTKSLISAN